MQKIATVIDRELKWEQPSAFKQLYELRTNDGLVATLTFPNSFRCNATGQSADGCWDFHREGPLHSRILIRPCGSSDHMAMFQKSWWKSCGTLELPDARAFRTASNLWASRYSFLDKSGEPIIELKNCGVLHRAATLTIARRALDIPELPMMVILAWYLDVMMQNEASVATMAAASG
jgi:hypothetical protein